MVSACSIIYMIQKVLSMLKKIQPPCTIKFKFSYSVHNVNTILINFLGKFNSRYLLYNFLYFFFYFFKEV